MDYLIKSCLLFIQPDEPQPGETGYMDNKYDLIK